MKKHTEKWIQLSESYNRSTNLELDFKDVSRLKDIYLSSKFQEGLKEVFTSILETNSKHRVRVLSGSPGLGKSTFALLIAQILSKKHPKFIGHLMNQANKKLQIDFNQFQKSRKTKLLPVFINGYEGEIEEVFKHNLKKALSENSLSLKGVFKDTLKFYKASLNTLKTKGYSGIFVIYDEFGKYLEKALHSPTDLNIQFLQNFAEFCDRSGETQCHLMLITHLSVSQYASQLPINVQQEWAKVEGRFQESAFYDKSADYYKMISAVFEKNISETHPSIAEKYKTYINKYLVNFSKDALEGFIDLKNIKSIILNCFPLHPSVLALLPHLSKKVAQNERTLYTFLTRDEDNSLKRFLQEKTQITLLMPYHLYKYFQPLIGKDIGIGGTYKIQLMVEEAFKYVSKTDEVSKQIISLMALCSVIKDTHFAPLTEAFIISCFNQDYSRTNIKKSLTYLRKKKVIFYNKNTKQYLLQEGSPVDIDEEIAKLKNITLTGKSLVQVLKRYFKTDFITPKKYNFENAITRFYRTEIISVEELKNLSKKNNIDFYREDGRLFYVIPFSHDELVYARREIQKISSPLTVFLLPKQFIECRKDIEELNAVDCLYNNKEILSASSLVKKELDRHKEILLSSIDSLLKPLIGYMGLSADVIYPTELSEQKEITHFKDLERFLGTFFTKEYNKYVSFNLEYMNRHSVSGSITLGRKKFLDTLRFYKEKPKGDITCLIKGHGPDYVILDTMLRLSSFKYHSVKNIYEVSSKSEYYKFFKEYKKILSQHPQGISASMLLDILVSPPYGLRLGVIPVFISLADLCFKQPVSHYFDSAYVKDLDGDHYDLLMKYPKKTTIHYTPIDNKKQKFLDGLGKIFKADGVSVRSVISALVKWRRGIPESTKFSSGLSQEGRKLLIQIDSSKQPDHLLFTGIPYCFEKTNVGRVNLQGTKDILLKLKITKKEIDAIYRNLLLKMEKELSSFISFINEQCLNHSASKTLQNKRKNVTLEAVSSVGKDRQNKSLNQISIIKNFQNILSQVKNYPFSSNTNRFVGRALNFPSFGHKQYFLETIADVLTGSSPRYWNGQGYSMFEFALKRVKTEIELGAEIANPQFKGKSVLAFIDKGQNKKTIIKLGAQFELEKRLGLALEQINKTLDSLDEIDKRKVVLALLENIDKKTATDKTLNFNSVQSSNNVQQKYGSQHTSVSRSTPKTYPATTQRSLNTGHSLTSGNPIWKK